MSKYNSPDPRALERDGKLLTAGQNKLDTELIDRILDRDWFDSVMMSKGLTMEDELDKVNRFWNTARVKFTDSGPGGNIGINPRPQFTPYADIREPGTKAGRSEVSPGNVTGDTGMGIYYSEAIDDNANIVYLRFGVPSFNSMFSFLTKAIDPNIARIANTGRSSVAHNIGKIIGSVLGLVKFTKVAVYFLTGRFVLGSIGTVLPIQSSKYYTLKPTMYLYWSAVNSLLAQMSINLGFISPTAVRDEDPIKGASLAASPEMMELLKEMFPNLVTSNNFIDMYAVATRAQRLANQRILKELDVLDQGNASTDQYVGLIDELLNKKVVDEENPTFLSFLNRELNSRAAKAEIIPALNKERSENITLEKDPLSPPEVEDEQGILDWINSGVKEYVSEMAEVYKAGWREGGQHAIFRVDHVDSVSESFSTSVSDSPIVSIVNSGASSSRNMKFTLAGGNVGDGPIVDLIEGLVGSAVDLAKGVIEGFTFGVSNIVTALLGGGYIDAPQQWENSSVTLPNLSYSTKLISPYGNQVSQLMNIYMPLAMFMAAALPLATGKNSYTSPFLCNLEHPGRQSIPLGIITSLSITRGTSNLSFTQDNRALAYDVSFTVTDLSSIMFMPIDTGGLFGVDMALDEDHILSRYMATITGRDVSSMFYTTTRAKIRLARELYKIDKLRSPAGLAMAINDSIPGRFLRIFAPKSSILRGVQDQ